MYLNRLRRLHQEMRNQDMDRCRFPFARNRARFQVVFLTDQTPYALLFGLVGGQWSFSVDVQTDYLIETTLDRQTYRELVRVLELEYDPKRPFRPADFFADLNDALPQRVGWTNWARPQDTAPFRRDVDDVDRIYLLRWLPQGKGRQVSERNLQKTHTLLGNATYELCRARKVSSVWTDDPNRAKEYWRRDLQRLLDQSPVEGRGHSVMSVPPVAEQRFQQLVDSQFVIPQLPVALPVRLSTGRSHYPTFSSEAILTVRFGRRDHHSSVHLSMRGTSRANSTVRRSRTPADLR